MSGTAADPAVRPVHLRTEDASGLATAAFRRPRLSWQLAASRDDVRQVAYEIETCPWPDFGRDVVTSGQVSSSSPIGADWPGAPLNSRDIVWCRVRVWTELGVTVWSEPLRLEGGLFDPGDWQARPISADFNTGQSQPAPVMLLRKPFVADAAVVSARLHVSALGIHDCQINGQAVSDALFDPGWTAYRDRLLYACHDVTALVVAGENVLSATIGDGWWRGNLTWMSKRAVYGDTTALIAQLEIVYADGRRAIVATDQTWRAGTGSLLRADLYDGCEIDLAAEPAGWRSPGFDDAAWAKVVTLAMPAALEQRSMPPVRVVETFDAAFSIAEPGLLKIDCQQNLTGFLRLTGHARCAGTIIVRHAEVLEPDGALHTAALRHAKATEHYHLPEGPFTVEPSFTYHGFRFAEIALDPDVTIDRVEVRVVTSDLTEIGHFACSDPRINQLFSNIRWSQRGNFLSIPTDCPQRDERLGWTGDIQVFAPTAASNFDCRAFLSSWLVDLALEQAPDGQVTSTVPNVIQGFQFEFAGVGWADAATLVPWALYEAYGDRTTLARQLPSMRAWVDWGASRLTARDTWEGDFHLGDWLDPGAPPDRPELATTDRDFIASGYLAFSAATVARAARVLGDDDTAAHYAALARRVAQGTWAHWREAALRTQAGCALAVMFDIAPPDQIAMVGAQLAALVDQADGRIATGFLGTPLVLPALSRAGQHEAAYRLLRNEQAPGWLYQVNNGATTMWERWDAIKPDGSLHGGDMADPSSDSMTSFNHYAYGSVGSWLYRTLAGIGPGEPGYSRIAFAPQPGGGIDWAEASIDTPYGRAAIDWRIEGTAMRVGLEIPAGARGDFTIPAGWALAGSARITDLGSGHHQIELVAP